MQAGSNGKKRQVKPNKTILSRTLVLMAVCGILAFIVLAARLFKVQIIDHDHYEQLAVEQQTRETTITADRGTILDRNGKILAMSASVETVFISPYEITTYEEDADLIATRLSEILGVERDSIIEKMADSKSWYKTIKKKIEVEEANQVREFISEYELRGVHLEPDTKRYYPYSSLACHVIGFTGTDNNGLEGLEYLYDEYLSGTNGRIVRLKNASGTDMLFSDFEDYYDAVDGCDVTLTIDVSIQSYVEKYLEQATADYDLSNGAACIVMDPDTCEVLALASYGNFDLNNYLDVSDEVKAELELIEDEEEYGSALADAQYAQWRNKAISDSYEPGSVFKTITLATALDVGAVSTMDSFYCGGTMEVLGRDTLHCWKSSGHGSQSLAQAAQNSCNCAFTTIGMRIGAETFWDYIGAFGFFDKTGIELSSEANSLWWSRDVFCDKNNLSSLAAASWGQTFNVTPIQMITAMCAVCNGGYLMKPYIVKSVTDSDGTIVEMNEPSVVRQVISRETSEKVNEILETVVSTGTGKNAYVAGYSIAGKTGTSTNTVMEAQGKKEYIVSFCGYAPADDPEVVVLLLLDSPSQSTGIYISGGVMAAPVVGNIITDVLDYMGYVPEYTTEELDVIDVRVPNVTGWSLSDASGALEYDGFEVRVIGEGEKVTAQLPAPGSMIASGSKVIVYTEGDASAEEISVPDISGMSYARAKEVLAAEGLFISSSTGSISSETVVGTQSISAGSPAVYGSVIEVTLIDKSIQGQF